MRLFLAVELDRAAQAGLARLLLDVQRALGDMAAALRWTPATNAHVTLHFLGELDARQAARLIDALGAALEEPAFRIIVDSIGALPPLGPPRIVWAGISTGADALTRIYAQSGARVRAAGLATEARGFQPHLTLGRVRDRDRRRVRGLRDRLPEIDVSPIEWRVDHVALLSSDLSGPVPKYNVVHMMSLHA